MSQCELLPSHGWGGRTAVRPLTITVAREDHDEKLREACGRGRNLLCVQVKVEVRAEYDNKGAHSVLGFTPLH